MTTRSRAFDLLRVWIAYTGKVSGGASVIPYEKCCIIIVGVDIYDDP